MFPRCWRAVTAGNSAIMMRPSTWPRFDKESPVMPADCVVLRIDSPGGTIYHVVRRQPWPGKAAVVVSIVHVRKGNWDCKCRLDDRLFDRITAFLFHINSAR